MLCSKIEINDGLIGILTTPAIINGKLPAVIMLHGFATDKDEVAGIYKIFSEKLADYNIISLRIDFHGWGESSGKMENTTIASLIADANYAYKYLSELNIVNILKIGICGFSLGAAIAILTSKQQGNLNIYKAIVAISPAGDLKNDFLNVFGDEIFKKITTDKEPYEIDLGWRKVLLNKSFFDSLLDYDPMKAIQSYNGAFFAIGGSNDFSAKHIKQYVELSPSLEKDSKIIPHADHIFNAFDQSLNFLQQMTNLSVDWFKSKL